mgnify:CR=1 FL=1
MSRYPKIDIGERMAIAGRTGSGKTTLASWMVRRSAGFWIVLNQKGDASLSRLGPNLTMDTWEDALDRGAKFAVIQPEPERTIEEIDDWIYALSEEWENIGLFVDELYYLTSNSRAGPGLTGWLTRGRSRRQSFIGLTQRPVWVSKFIFSESDYLVEMSLALKDDRKRMYEMSGMSEMLEKLPARYWRCYRQGSDDLVTYGPVPT